MSRCNKNEYVEGRTSRPISKIPRKRGGDPTVFFVKYNNPGAGTKGVVPLTAVYFPEEYVGKRVRFKIEVIE